MKYLLEHPPAHPNMSYSESQLVTKASKEKKGTSDGKNSPREGENENPLFNIILTSGYLRR